MLNTVDLTPQTLKMSRLPLRVASGLDPFVMGIRNVGFQGSEFAVSRFLFGLDAAKGCRSFLCDLATSLGDLAVGLIRVAAGYDAQCRETRDQRTHQDAYRENRPPLPLPPGEGRLRLRGSLRRFLDYRVALRRRVAGLSHL
jgi:hypothetical protein